jgi:anti-sigma regulatory factor (Ser/Thr protein kinase)
VATSHSTSRRFANVPGALGSVRRWFADELAEHASFDVSEREDAVLVLNELVVNAFVHADSDACVRVTFEGTSVHVEVSDDGPGRPELRTPDPGEGGSRGLCIVDAIATAWGSRHHTDGTKDVWFLLVGR